MNRREAHLQQLDKQNLLQALGVAARGESWEAVYEDEQGRAVLVLLSAGCRLQELVREYFPTLDPYASSAAVRKGQGSSIEVRDEGVYAQLVLSPARVACAGVCRDKVHRRPAPVVWHDEGGEEPATWLCHDGVHLPPAPEVNQSRDSFEGGDFPPDEWFQHTSLRAYSRLDVHVSDAKAIAGKHRQLSLYGECVSGHLPSRVLLQFRTG